MARSQRQTHPADAFDPDLSLDMSTGDAGDIVASAGLDFDPAFDDPHGDSSMASIGNQSGTSGRRGRQMIHEESGVSKRTLQNRKAQREFRARRATYLKELEDRIKAFEANSIELGSDVHTTLVRLRDENAKLRAELQRVSPSSLYSFPPPVRLPDDLFDRSFNSEFNTSPSTSGIPTAPDMPRASQPLSPTVHALLPSSKNPATLPMGSAYGAHNLSALVNAVSANGHSGLTQPLPQPMRTTGDTGR